MLQKNPTNLNTFVKRLATCSLRNTDLESWPSMYFRQQIVFDFKQEIPVQKVIATQLSDTWMAWLEPQSYKKLFLVKIFFLSLISCWLRNKSSFVQFLWFVNHFYIYFESFPLAVMIENIYWRTQALKSWFTFSSSQFEKFVINQRSSLG